MRTIQAVYENGVLRPVEDLALPEKSEVKITIHTSDSNASSLAKLAEIAREFPENAELPTDLAAQHDHYLYGTPKKP